MFLVCPAGRQLFMCAPSHHIWFVSALDMFAVLHGKFEFIPLMPEPECLVELYSREKEAYISYTRDKSVVGTKPEMHS